MIYLALWILGFTIMCLGSLRKNSLLRLSMVGFGFVGMFVGMFLTFKWMML
jgi:hypothetical protein